MFLGITSTGEIFLKFAISNRRGCCRADEAARGRLGSCRAGIARRLQGQLARDPPQRRVGHF